MSRRTILRVLAVLVLVALAIGIGTAIYNVGVSAGLAAAQEAGASGDAVPVDRFGYPYGGPYAHGPWGFGFGFFGILFTILVIFLVIGLVRAAFGGGGHWRGPGGPGGWGDRRDRIEEFHRELHRREHEGEQRPAGA